MALGKETSKGAGGWFPSIIGPNQIFARNNSGEEDVVPTPYYAQKTMPKFRKNPAGNDNDDDDASSGWPQKGQG